MVPQHWLTTDFYDVLGVPEDCTDETLRRAYRGMARRHHPDVNAGSPQAEHRFRDVCAAYAVLSDRTSRARYDRSRGRLCAHGASPPPRRASRPASGRDHAEASDSTRTSGTGGGVPVTDGPGGTASLGGWGALMWAPSLWAMSAWTSTARMSSGPPAPWPAPQVPSRRPGAGPRDAEG